MGDVDEPARGLLKQLVLGLNGHAHKYLPQACAELGLPASPPARTDDDRSVNKYERLLAVAEQVHPQQYHRVLRNFLHRGCTASLRNEIQDVLWAQESWPAVNERARREVAESLERAGGLCVGNSDGLMSMLGRLFVLESEMDAWTGQGLATDIRRHVLDNPDDWTVLELFRRIGALNSSDRRFALFLQGLLSSEVCPDEARQRELAAAIAPALTHAGLRVEQTGDLGGYPDFSVLPTGATSRPPQLILFASQTSKPDLRLARVLDKQIEVMSRSSDVLSYDRPIGDEGLTWERLQAWWAEREHLTAEEARGSLWRRLRASVVAAASPPQLALFDQYHQVYGTPDGAVMALLPEVWLHWDPVAKRQRGDDALPAQRMDFLMLLRGRRRVVLEVDGAQHYSEKGHPSPAVYAQTVRADRDLRLSGYEVFRFGGHELVDDRARATVVTFFDRLLGRGPR